MVMRLAASSRTVGRVPVREPFLSAPTRVRAGLMKAWEPSGRRYTFISGGTLTMDRSWSE